MSTVEALLKSAAGSFVESDSAHLDAQLLLAHAMGVDRTWLYTWNDAEVSASQVQAFDTLVRRRVQGEPIAFILGQREFWGRNFYCLPSTLIPRPDTELVVELSLQKSLSSKAQVLDLGTGTGCIAVSIAKEKLDWSVLAVDVSEDALSLAKKNAQRHGCENIHFQQSDWFSGIAASARFDLIVSNPPYVEVDSPDLKKGDLRYEPTTALVSGKDGLQDLDRIITMAPNFFASTGVLILEHGFAQAKAVISLMVDRGFHQVKTYQDLAGLDRCTLGVWSS